MTPISIAIVGSGLSALSFVKKLLSSSNCSSINQITLFEKSRGVGGRMATRRTTMDGSTIYFDHGAQYFTVRSEEFKGQVNQWLDQKKVMLWDEPVVSLESDMTVKQKSANGSLSDQILHNKNEPILRYISTGSGMNGICKLIKSEVMDIALRSKVTVKFEMEKHVKTITKDISGKWKIGLIDSNIDDLFDLIVLSCPPEQSVQLLKNMNHSSVLLEKIEKMKMHPCWAMMISFPKKLDQTFIKGGAFVNVENSSISWICNQSSRNTCQEREVWVIHASKLWSTKNLEKSSEEVQQILYNDFLQLLSQFERKNVSNILVEKADHISVHRWRYSIPFTSNPTFSKSEWYDNGICCIGDWTQQGKIEGAYLSGVGMADFLVPKL